MRVDTSGALMHGGIKPSLIFRDNADIHYGNMLYLSELKREHS